MLLTDILYLSLKQNWPLSTQAAGYATYTKYLRGTQYGEHTIVCREPGVMGLTYTKLCLGRHEWVEALSPLCPKLNLG